MRSLAIATSVALALMAGGCHRGTPVGPTASTATTPKEVVEGAKATIEQWRQAYEIRSIDALAKLYAHDLDVVVVQEGTTMIGWSSVEGMLKDRLSRAGEIHVRLKDIQVSSLAPNVASAVVTMTRELTDGATTVTENGTLTLVLRNDSGTWVLTSEHYSYKR
jgi:ketosteroid isomerase-like protein